MDSGAVKTGNDFFRKYSFHFLVTFTTSGCQTVVSVLLLIMRSMTSTPCMRLWS